MTVEHLHPLLCHSGGSRLFFQAAEMLARARVPPAIKDAIRLGRLIALRKTDGSVRGILAGDIVRRVVARTISQQLMEALLQHAMSTRAGCECVAHALQGITEMSATATITSIDGTSARDLISRRGMLEGLRRVDETVVPFVFMFCSSPSGYLWEDSDGTTHTDSTPTGGPATVARRRVSLRIWMTFTQSRNQIACGLWWACWRMRCGHGQGLASTRARRRYGTAQGWNRQDARFWKGWRGLRIRLRMCGGPELPAELLGLNILGTPLGKPEFVRDHLERTVQKHQKLLERIPVVPDVQSSWLLLLHCASARANYMTRVVEPARSFCEAHDVGI